MRKLKKITSLLTAAVILCSSFSVSAAFTPTEKSLNSKSVYMVNTDTGTVIYKQNEHEKLYPASFVKVMVAIMVLEKFPDPKKITVTAPNYIFDELFVIGGASTADIRQGEKVRMIDLLYAMILPSACEAGSIIADYMGNGDIPGFVEQMNKRAKELGCKDTNFVNAHGLHNPDQVSSAYDMYLIAKHAMTFPLFAKIATTRQYEMPKTNKHSTPRNIYHTNTMMTAATDYYYPYIKGIKTGTTDESGKNLMSLATKSGYNYMLITMGAPTKYDNGNLIKDNLCFIDTQNLYTWAFDNYAVKTVVEKKDSVADVKVKLSWDADHVLLTPKEDVTALLPSDADITSVQQIPNLPESINAPVKAGQKIGTLTLKLAGEEIGKVDLIASKDVNSNAFLSFLNSVKKIFSSTIFKIIIVAIILLIVLYLVFIIAYNKKYKRNRVHRSRRRNKRSRPRMK